MDTILLSLLRNPETPDGVLRDRVLELAGEGRAVASVYVVYGRCGSYSDERTWHVSAYLDRAHADARAAALTEWAKKEAVHADAEGRFNGLIDGARGGRIGYPLVRSNHDTRGARADALGLDDWSYLEHVWEKSPDEGGREEARSHPMTDVHYGVFEIPLRAEGP